MVYLIYENNDEKTQVFIGMIVIGVICFVILANIYYWIKDKLKKK